MWEVFLWRCLADSNRRRRFCRPLTKPLIQGTICFGIEVFSNAGAKVLRFFETTKFFSYFFVQQHDFFFFWQSFSSFSWHPVQPSQGSLLLLILCHTHQIAYPTAAIIAKHTRNSCIFFYFGGSGARGHGGARLLSALEDISRPRAFVPPVPTINL